MSESGSEDLVNQLSKLVLTEDTDELKRQKKYSMAPEQLQSIINVVVVAALKVQREDFEAKLKAVTATTESAPEIAIYLPVAVTGKVTCDEGLDAVKSLPEFDGSQGK
ncbi:hypothetical protein KR059_004185, partial [Drosophila kikkawai]